MEKQSAVRVSGLSTFAFWAVQRLSLIHILLPELVEKLTALVKKDGKTPAEEPKAE